MRFFAYAAIALAASAALAETPAPAPRGEDTAIVIWEAPPAPPVPAALESGGASRGSDTAVPRPASGGETLEGPLTELSWLAGRWQFRRQTPGAGPEARPEVGRVIARPGPGGHSIILETTVIDGPGAGASAMEIIVPSPDGRGFEVHSFTSDAPIPSVATAWLDGGVLGWKRTVESEGKRVTTEVRIEKAPGERMTRIAESVVEGQKGSTLLVTPLVRR